MGSPFLRRVLMALLLLVAAIIVGLVWMAGGVQSPRRFPTRVERVRAQPKTGTAGLSVVSWNIAWAYGWGSEGRGAAKAPDHFERTLTRIAETLEALDADVVLLQEVDFRSTRSHHTDQARALAERAGYPFIARAESWRANWVPFPYWPIRNQFGRMSSGGAILSRYPMSDAEVILFDKPSSNPFWYNLFYLFRYVQTARLILPDRSVTLVNTHLEAFDRPTREMQAQRIVEIVRSALQTGPLVLGGDLNSVPPESTTRGGYEDEPETEHGGEHTISMIRSIGGVADTVPAATFSKDEKSFFTFPAHAPNRKLDFLFGSEDLRVVEARTGREAGSASDHLPVLARFAFD